MAVAMRVDACLLVSHFLGVFFCDVVSLLFCFVVFVGTRGCLFLN